MLSLLTSASSHPGNDLTLGYQTSNSASSSNFHHLALFALLVALVLHKGDSMDLNFAILYTIIDIEFTEDLGY